MTLFSAGDKVWARRGVDFAPGLYVVVEESKTPYGYIVRPYSGGHDFECPERSLRRHPEEPR